MRVLLQTEVLQRADALHDAEEVVVAAEEDVQTHLDVVAVLVHPGTHLPAVEPARVEDVDLVPSLAELHGGDHTRETRADDTYGELLVGGNLDPRALECPKEEEDDEEEKMTRKKKMQKKKREKKMMMMMMKEEEEDDHDDERRRRRRRR